MRSMLHRTWPARSTRSWTVHPWWPIPLTLVLESRWTLLWRSVSLMHWRTLRPRRSSRSRWASHMHRTRHGVIVGRSHSRWHIGTHSHTWRTTWSVRPSWTTRPTHGTSRSHRTHAHVRSSRWPRRPIDLGLSRWSRPRFLLAFELIQRLFRRQRHNRILAVQFLLREPIHHIPHTILRSQRNDAESFRLSVGAVFKEFHFLKVTNAHIRDGVGNVLIRRPPGQVSHVQLKPPSHMVHWP